MRRIIPLLLVAPLLAPFLVGCGLTRRALELEKSRLQDELEAMQRLEADLQDPAFPPGSRHLELFVGYDVFNQVLAGVDNLQAPLPNAPDVLVNLEEIRLEPRDGLAVVRIAANAVRDNLRLDVVMRAQIILDPSTDPMTARLRVQEIAPVFSWHCVQFARWKLARTIATAKADEFALSHLTFPVPIEHAFALNAPAVLQELQMDTPRGNGSWVRIRVTRDPIALSRSIRLDRALFLRDGLHLFATIA